MKLSALVAALALAAAPALAQSARVVDGDTLKVDGMTYRLFHQPAPARVAATEAGLCFAASKAFCRRLRAPLRAYIRRAVALKDPREFAAVCGLAHIPTQPEAVLSA